MRINKFLAKLGWGSRREIDQAIADGLIHVNNKTAELGQQLKAGDKLKFDNEEIIFEEKNNLEINFEKVYIVFYKPPGIVSTSQTDEGTNIYQYLYENKNQFMGDPERYEELASKRFHHIGRLDKESRGLMILTNDGNLTQELTHPKYEHEKEYLVTCKNNFDDEFLENFSSGVWINREDDDKDRVLTERCLTQKVSPNQFRVVLKQGYNRQIRKMIKALKNEVTDLLRIRISNIVLAKYLNNEMIDKKYQQNLIILNNLRQGEFIEIQYSSI